MTALFDLLNDLGRSIEKDLPKINYGGCAVVAAEIATALDSRLNIPARVRTSAPYMHEFDVCDVDVARILVDDPDNATATDWGDAGLSFGHVIVEFRYNGTWYHYDTSGVVPSRKRTNQFNYVLFPGYLTITEARSIADSPDGWNPQFDRQYIPYLRNKITQYFSEIQEKLTSMAI